jgi:hypothetical protein
MKYKYDAEVKIKGITYTIPLEYAMILNEGDVIKVSENITGHVSFKILSIFEHRLIIVCE